MRTPADSTMTKRSVVVTGAAGGIGRGIVAELLARGWSVVGLDLEESRFDGYGESFASVRGDVSDPASHARAADAAETLAPLQGWVNCAGFNILGSVVEVGVDRLTEGISVDLFGVFHGTAEAARRFLAQESESRAGSIVNISSIQAAVGFPGFAAYAMAKGGIESLSRQVAAEYVTQGIRCNVVAPGLVESPMNDALLSSDPASAERVARWRQITPMGRWATSADVAKAVSFLLGEDSAYISGEVLAVNGGALALAPGQGPL